MMAAWIAYCLSISLLLGAAAVAAEHGLRLYQRPVRWLWLGAMVASIIVPPFAWLIPEWRGLSPEPLQPALSAAIDGVIAVAGPLTSADTSRSLFARIDTVLIVLWSLASGSLLAFYLRSYLRVRRARREWTTRELDGKSLWVSEKTGPAVLGLFNGAIVVPAWVLSQEEEVRRVIVLHEEEHLRAGDHRLVFLALIVLILMPWNLSLWWQVRRLRLAVELDCDRRVLRRGAHPHDYGSLLIEIGRRTSHLAWVAAAFAVRVSLLERRLRNMIAKTPAHRLPRCAAAALISALFIALACETPVPERLSGEGPATEPTAVVAPAPADIEQLGEKPYFTPIRFGLGSSTEQRQRGAWSERTQSS